MIDIANAVICHRRWAVVACVLVGLLLLPFAPKIASQLEVGGSAVDDSEAARVEKNLETRFATPFASTLVLTVTGIPSIAEDAGLDMLIEIVDAVNELDSVVGALSYIDTVDPIFVTPHGTFVVVGISDREFHIEEIVQSLRRTTESLQSDWRHEYPPIALSWTGGAALDYDVRLTSTQDATDAERRVLPIVAFLLFLVFGSVMSALFPVIIGGLGVGLCLGAAVLISRLWPMTVVLQNIVTMIGLGIGIDYTLLMLSRFREQLQVNPDANRAAVEALRNAGHTIVLSGGAVAIGFAALLFVPAMELRSIAAGGLLVVVFSVLLATTLLPAVLSWLGPRIEMGRLWRRHTRLQSSRYWQVWGRWVAANPLRVLAVVGIPLLALAWQARHISTDIPSGSWLPMEMESTQGVVALQRMGQGGIIQTIRVVVEFPPGVAADSEAAWELIFSLGDTFAADERVARVSSLAELLGVENANQATKAFIAPEWREAYISEDGQLALIDIVPTDNASAGTLMDYVRELRRIDIDAQGSLNGADIEVGGLPAFNADYQDAIGGNVVNIILFIVVASFLALFIGFRSLLGALKAVALNLLSVAAAMGATVLVFQQGYGSEWLGIAEPLDGLFPAVPIIVFCVVFGLSMDYEVFLLARVAEGVRQGLSNHDALVEGLARTGGVITSAALVMIVVFAGFSLGEFLIIKILGFSLAVAIAVDATVVRLAIGPALLQLGGRWNWWPGRR